MEPVQVGRRIGTGLLAFPVTHFADDLRFAERSFRDHCRWLLERDVAGLFAAGGTSEFFSLTPDEVSTVVRAAVDEAGGRVPVLSGCGYGTATAVGIARRAEAAGIAEGISHGQPCWSYVRSRRVRWCRPSPASVGSRPRSRTRGSAMIPDNA